MRKRLVTRLGLSQPALYRPRGLQCQIHEYLYNAHTQSWYINFHLIIKKPLHPKATETNCNSNYIHTVKCQQTVTYESRTSNYLNLNHHLIHKAKNRLQLQSMQLLKYIFYGYITLYHIMHFDSSLPRTRGQSLLYGALVHSFYIHQHSFYCA